MTDNKITVKQRDFWLFDNIFKNAFKMTEWKECVECGDDSCIILQDNDGYDYCCNCLPVKYITKPVREWMCEACACVIHGYAWCLHGHLRDEFHEHTKQEHFETQEENDRKYKKWW